MNNITSSKNVNLDVKIENFSKIRNKNYYNNSKMLYNSFYGQTSNKKKNFYIRKIYKMNLDFLNLI
jgi:hypothetical protein